MMKHERGILTAIFSRLDPYSLTSSSWLSSSPRFWTNVGTLQPVAVRITCVTSNLWCEMRNVCMVRVCV